MQNADPRLASYVEAKNKAKAAVKEAAVKEAEAEAEAAALAVCAVAVELSASDLEEPTSPSVVSFFEAATRTEVSMQRRLYER